MLYLNTFTSGKITSHRRIIAIILFLFLSSATAIDFVVKDLEDHAWSLADYRGKWVVINFWATWCSSCRAEIQDLNAFYLDHQHQGDVMVVGFNIFDSASDVALKKFIRGYEIAYPIARATSSVVRALGPVRVLPTTYLVDPTGKVMARQVGSVTRASIENFIRHRNVSNQ